MIIDVHAHVGEDVVFDVECSEKDLINAYKEYDITGAIVQPYLPRIYIEDHKAIHDRIYELTKSTEKKFWGMASINPHFRPEDYDREATRCVKELGFVAIKITPLGHSTHPSSKDALHVWEVCRELNVPIMIHTGVGVPFSDPISVDKALSMFRDVPCILAHAGSEMHNQQATYLAHKYENAFLEPSWVSVLGVANMVKTVGTTKIMFSSDHILNIPVELAKYKSLLKNEVDLENIFYKNAVKVFKLTT